MEKFEQPSAQLIASRMSDEMLLKVWDAMVVIEDWDAIVNGVTMLEWCEIVYSERTQRGFGFSTPETPVFQHELLKFYELDGWD